MNTDIYNRIQDIPFKQYTGVYLLYKNNVLVYVGVACDIAVRLWQHRFKQGKDWDVVRYIEETDYLNAIKIENHIINTYKPLYNKAGAKYENIKYSFKERFDENTIPYPSGWKPRSPIQP